MLLFKKVTFSVSAFANCMKSSFLDDLQKNKNGIHVSVETDFGKADIGERKRLTVWVQNKGVREQVFLRAHLPAECKQIKIEGRGCFHSFTCIII